MILTLIEHTTWELFLAHGIKVKGQGKIKAKSSKMTNTVEAVICREDGQDHWTNFKVKCQ